MQDHPEPTEEEQEQTPERREEEEAMRGPQHQETPTPGQAPDEPIHEA